mmetsp:Transcript_62301/g.148737  ORF Transcript_62301/g.148737 Transcript_62301/m.148737 type:complete len:296 (-) Transcript_62301:244-1131(-)
MGREGPFGSLNLRLWWSYSRCRSRCCWRLWWHLSRHPWHAESRPHASHWHTWVHRLRCVAEATWGGWRIEWSWHLALEALRPPGEVVRPARWAYPALVLVFSRHAASAAATNEVALATILSKAILLLPVERLAKCSHIARHQFTSLAMHLEGDLLSGHIGVQKLRANILTGEVHILVVATEAHQETKSLLVVALDHARDCGAIARWRRHNTRRHCSALCRPESLALKAIRLLGKVLLAAHRTLPIHVVRNGWHARWKTHRRSTRWRATSHAFSSAIWRSTSPAITAAASAPHRQK